MTLLAEAGARDVRAAHGVVTGRWRGAPVRLAPDGADAAARARAALAALAHLPDPVAVAEIDLVRHGSAGAAPVFVPVVSVAEGRQLRVLCGDSFLVILDRDSGAMCVLGDEADGAPLRLEHRIPRAPVGHEQGLALRTAAHVLGGERGAAWSGMTRTDHEAKLTRLLPHLRCVRCETRAPLARDGEGLVCAACAASYPVLRGVPVLMRDPAASIEPGPGEISSNSYTRQALALFDAHASGFVLDCGSGRPTENLPQVVHLEVCRYENVDVVASSDALPFAEGTFDAALCESVLEHVPDPWAVVDELHRVLRAGGALRVDAPFIAPFHAYPDHYYNFTQSGLLRLLRRFDVVDTGIGPHQEPWVAVGWILNLVREGLRDEARRAAFDALPLGGLLQQLATGEAPRVLHPLDDATRRSLAAGFYVFARKR